MVSSERRKKTGWGVWQQGIVELVTDSATVRMEVSLSQPSFSHKKQQLSLFFTVDLIIENERHVMMFHIIIELR